MNRYRLQLAEVPLIAVSGGEPHLAALRGTVLFIHGFGASKDANVAELERFARAGFLAIGLDAVGHGERRFPDFDARFGGPDREARMFDVVRDTTRELPELVGLLRSAGWAHEGRVGLVGVSMGGFVAYGAIPSRDFAAVVTLISSPEWRSDAPEHPRRHLDAFFPCALLSQFALRDALIRADEVRAFHRELQPRYQAAPDRLATYEFPHSEHFMREEDWHLAIDNATRWFSRHLRGSENLTPGAPSQ